jgi:hypothetical protein
MEPAVTVDGNVAADEQERDESDEADLCVFPGSFVHRIPHLKGIYDLVGVGSSCQFPVTSDQFKNNRVISQEAGLLCCD